MAKRVAFTVLLAAGLMAWVGCDSSRPAPVQASPPKPVTLPAPAPTPTFLASGPLVVENQVDVAAQRDGVVAKIDVDAGTPVRKGQLLGMLDDRQIAADKDAADAKVRSTQADLQGWEGEVKVLQADRERAEKMWDAQLITKQDLDHARYKVEADQYEVERVRENLKNAQASALSLALELEKTRILAPFDGVVARRYVRVGQRVAVGDRLFWVTAVAPLRIRFTLPERFVGHIQVGDQLTVTAATDSQQEHRAKVLQVSPVVDPSSDTIEVLAEITGPAGELRPGMTANVQIPNPK
ncbi:MAG TPA: efflux RND transporter periplasmic adaptor subunit [Terriglobales bacterium]|nr:efflux RND transporter periplasmic adaptor subunit [Terriglobales bacterium]